MPSITDLPTELLLEIFHYCPSIRAVLQLAGTCKRMHEIWSDHAASLVLAKSEYVRASNLTGLLELAALEDAVPIAALEDAVPIAAAPTTGCLPPPTATTTTATMPNADAAPTDPAPDLNLRVRHYLPRLARMDAACRGHLAEFTPRLAVFRHEARRQHPGKSLRGYYVRHGSHDFTRNAIFHRIKLWYWFHREPGETRPVVPHEGRPQDTWKWTQPGGQALANLVADEFRARWEQMGVAAKDPPEWWR